MNLVHCQDFYKDVRYINETSIINQQNFFFFPELIVLRFEKHHPKLLFIFNLC